MVAGIDSPAQQRNNGCCEALPLFLIAFFGYLGPAVVRSRFEQNMRGKLEQGILAFLIGHGKRLHHFQHIGIHRLAGRNTG